VQKVKTQFKGEMHQLIIEMYAESLQNGWWCLFQSQVVQLGSQRILVDCGEYDDTEYITDSLDEDKSRSLLSSVLIARWAAGTSSAEAIVGLIILGNGLTGIPTRTTPLQLIKNGSGTPRLWPQSHIRYVSLRGE
jgi:hypothetical protein